MTSYDTTPAAVIKIKSVDPLRAKTAFIRMKMGGQTDSFE